MLEDCKCEAEGKIMTKEDDALYFIDNLFNRSPIPYLILVKREFGILFI